jgi:hypothetical protein
VLLLLDVMALVHPQVNGNVSRFLRPFGPSLMKKPRMFSVSVHLLNLQVVFLLVPLLQPYVHLLVPMNTMFNFFLHLRKPPWSANPAHSFLLLPSPWTNVPWLSTKLGLDIQVILAMSCLLNVLCSQQTLKPPLGLILMFCLSMDVNIALLF